jgi:hypothetical protein
MTPLGSSSLLLLRVKGCRWVGVVCADYSLTYLLTTIVDLAGRSGVSRCAKCTVTLIIKTATSYNKRGQKECINFCYIINLIA